MCKKDFRIKLLNNAFGNADIKLSGFFVESFQEDVIENKQYTIEEYIDININEWIPVMINETDEENIPVYEYLKRELEKIKNIEVEEYNFCDICGEIMLEGYCIEGGAAYYCSDECLNKDYTEEEYEELYDDGDGDSYWSEWEF